MPKSVAILIFENVEELDAVGPLEVFGTMARLRPDLIEVCLVAERDEVITGVHGMRMLPHAKLSAITKVDIMVVPGGIGTRQQMQNVQVVDWIRRTASCCTWVASVCSGARLTLAAGVATGKRITSHWGVIDELREHGGAAEVLDDVRFVRDDNLVSSAGVSAGIDMSLWLVGQLGGPALARQVQREMEYSPAPPYAFDV